MNRVTNAIRVYLTEWLDFYRPTTRDVTWVLGGFVGMILALIAVAIGFDAIEPFVGGYEPASHQTATDLKNARNSGGVSNQAFLRTLAGLWVAAIIEEFAFRNNIQKLFAAFTGWPVAILLASILFALIHIPAYGGLPLTFGLLESLSAMFVAGIVNGTVYWRTGNILAAMALHGCWNTFVLAFILYGA